MTVSTELSHEEYVGNGVTTDFDFRFRIFESKHLIVVVADSEGNETTLKNGTDYTIVGAGSFHGGKVVLNKPLARGWTILLERDLPVVQETDLRNQGKFFAEVHEDAFDYLTMLIQKALGTFSLSLRKPTYLSNYYDAKGNRIANLAPPKLGNDSANKDYVDNSIKDIDSKTLRVKDKPINALPNTEQRANKLLAFNDDGQPIVVLPETGSASDVLMELAKPTGSKLIGFGQTTVDEKLKEIKSVIDYGVKGDGSDESLKLQDAINSGMVVIPPDIKIAISNITIPKGTEFHFGVNSEIILLKVDSIKFEKDEYRYVSNNINIGEKEIPYIGSALPTDLKYVKINRPWDASDAWYIANSENPDELGYTAELFEVESVLNSRITLKSGIPFELNLESNIQIINDYNDIHFFGGIISAAYHTNDKWMNADSYISNVYFHRTKFNFNGKGGIRFNACHRIIFNKCIGIKSGNGGNIMFAYGSTDCSVKNSVLIGGKVYDAQLVAFAGCRRIVSSGNLLLSELDDSNLSGVYFGAKTIGCKSIDDTIIGGRWGIAAMFGAQRFEIIRPTLHGQITAGVYFERCQYFSLINPNIDFDGSLKSISDVTWGAIVIKDCDSYKIETKGIPIKAIGRMLSVYSFSENRGKIRNNIDINISGNGDSILSVPISNSRISIKTDGDLSLYQGGNIMQYTDVIDCRARKLTLNNIAYCNVKRNKIEGTGNGIGIDILGYNSSWNDIDENSIINFEYGINIPDSELCKYSNNIGMRNYFLKVKTPINNVVSSDDKPIVPYSSSRPPVKGFFLSVNNIFLDINLLRTASGFRHSGSNAGKKSDWYKVVMTEERLND